MRLVSLMHLARSSIRHTGGLHMRLRVVLMIVGVMAGDERHLPRLRRRLSMRLP